MADGVLTAVFPPGVDPDRTGKARDRDTSLVVVPWFHAMGTVGYLNIQVLGGPRWWSSHGLTRGNISKPWASIKATVLGGAPQLYIPLDPCPISSERSVLYQDRRVGRGTPGQGGPRHDARGVLRRGLEAYGLTECTMGATSNPPDRSQIRPGSVGLPVYDTE